jgi:hypothetical protein
LFDVLLQGKVVLDDFDVVDEAKVPLKSVTREFTCAAIDGLVTIDLQPAGDSERGAVLAGVEIAAAD